MHGYAEWKDTEDEAPTYWLPCEACRQETHHRVARGVERDWATDDLQGSEKLEIVTCCGCDTASFRRGDRNSEQVAIDDDTGEHDYYESVSIYPPRASGRRKLEQTYELPPRVRQLYEETYTALCSDLKVLSLAGIRALVEAVCQERKAKGRNLELKIDSLVTQGDLTRTGADVLHKLRDLGNKALHNAKRPHPHELNRAFDVLEHLLMAVYVIPTWAEDSRAARMPIAD